MKIFSPNKIVLFAALLLALAGCKAKKAAVKGDRAKATPVVSIGNEVQVNLEVETDGSLYALAISTAGENMGTQKQDAEKGSSELANGKEDKDGKEIESSKPGNDTKNEANDQSGESGDNGSTLVAYVESVSPATSSFTILSGIEVVAGIDCQNGVTPDGTPCSDANTAENNDADLVQCQDGKTSAGKPCADSNDPAESPEKNEAKNLAITEVTVGTWVEISGSWSEADNAFLAEEISVSDEQLTQAEGALTDITHASFSLAGLTIRYDATTKLIRGSSEEEKPGNEADNDTTQCEQKGENQNDNGCK